MQPAARWRSRLPSRSSIVRYISTRHGSQGDPAPLGFEDVMLAGLARDGGLYLPAEWPHFSTAEIAALKGLSYGELAFRIMRPFVGDAFDEATFRRLIGEAYASFETPDVAPLKALGDSGLHLLELFHGPTLAFKDVALQLLGRMLDHTLRAKRPACDDRRRHLRRHRLGRHRGGARPQDHRHLHAASARPGERGAAPPDDDGAGAQRAQHRHRRHVRRLPGPRQGLLQRSRLPRPPCADGGELDQLRARDGADRLLLLGRAEARRARAAGRLHRADRQFRQRLCRLRRPAHGPADASLRGGDQHATTSWRASSRPAP